jgi:hypothetical protein
MTTALTGDPITDSKPGCRYTYPLLVLCANLDRLGSIVLTLLTIHGNIT